MDTTSISPAGDGFYAAAKYRPDDPETPHGCYDGWVYLGSEGEDEDGEHVEEIERVPCRRCNAQDLQPWAPSRASSSLRATAWTLPTTRTCRTSDGPTATP